MYLDHPGLWTESMRRKKLIADGSVQPSLLYLLDAPGIQVGWSRPPNHHTSPPSHVFILSPSGLPCCVLCISKQMYLYDPKNNFQHPNSFWQSWMIKENDAACWAWPFINQYKVLSKRGSSQPQSSLNHVVCKSPWRLCSSVTLVIASGDRGHWSSPPWSSSSSPLVSLASCVPCGLSGRLRGQSVPSDDVYLTMSKRGQWWCARGWFLFDDW